MANPFSNFREYVDKPKRNSYDLSFQNNLTLDYGYLYPACCIEAIPGVSYRIQPNLAFNFMPTAFPIQTRQRAYLQFFYVRTRNLWKDWPDFIGKTKTGLVPPYIDFAGQTPQTGSLYDYFGLPTTRVGSYGSGTLQSYVKPSDISGYFVNEDCLFPYLYGPSNGHDSLKFDSITSLRNGIIANYNLVDGDPNNFFTNISQIAKDYPMDYWESDSSYDSYLSSNNQYMWRLYLQPNSISLSPFVLIDKFEAMGLSDKDIVSFHLTMNNASLTDLNRTAMFFLQKNGASGNKISIVTFPATTIKDNSIYFQMTFSEFKEKIKTYSTSDGFFVFALGFSGTSHTSEIEYDNVSALGLHILTSPTGIYFYGVENSSAVLVEDIDESSSPYYDSTSSNKDSQLKIDAYPFRAYESICNVYFRDDRNNPFMLNGQPEYNKYITTNEGGADNTRYKLYRRNWEQDFLTTAVQSPQQGIAPLVGITQYGDMTFAGDDGTLYHAKANVSSDGNTIESFSVLSSDMPSGNLRALVDMVSSGIGINDLRNVNALQRWLETNIRRGFKYRDQIMSHFGVDVRYDELDMPEFIGGMSQDVSIRQINNTSTADGSTLGDYAGQMFIGGSSGRSITHYCDEHGYIIGILSIVPVPVYSQLLPKHFLKNDPLDYYFPEFGHIGMQPIMYSEVCPVQTYNSNPADLNKEFGYQRAWYDYLQRVDECHGLFRTELQNFLLNRVFNEKPELSEEFLKVDPEQLNRVFTVTKYGNKILGNIYFEIEAKEPIPLFGIPSLVK